MKTREVSVPTTVGELKAALARLPDGMEVGRLSSGHILPVKISVQVRGKSNKHRVVSRGGIPFLAVLDI